MRGSEDTQDHIQFPKVKHILHISCIFLTQRAVAIPNLVLGDWGTWGSQPRGQQSNTITWRSPFL